MNDYISTTEAAKLIGCSASGFRRRCQMGKVPGVVRFDSRYRVSRQILLDWLRTRQVVVRDGGEEECGGGGKRSVAASTPGVEKFKKYAK